MELGIKVKEDIWILVPQLGPKTNILGFRTMGLRFWQNRRSENKTDLKFELVVKVQVKGDIWILVPHLDPKTKIVGFRTMTFRFWIN